MSAMVDPSMYSNWLQGLTIPDMPPNPYAPQPQDGSTQLPGMPTVQQYAGMDGASRGNIAGSQLATTMQGGNISGLTTPGQMTPGAYSAALTQAAPQTPGFAPFGTGANGQPNAPYGLNNFGVPFQQPNPNQPAPQPGVPSPSQGYRSTESIAQRAPTDTGGAGGAPPANGIGPNGMPANVASTGQLGGVSSSSLTGSSGQPSSGGPNVTGYTASQVASPSPYNVAQVAAPPTPAEYAQSLQTAFSPYFQQSQDKLMGDLQARGILTSGAGNQGLQDLTAMNNSTYAQALMPLIQQGFGQQFQANSANAGATNAMYTNLFNATQGANQFNAGAQNTAGQVNSGALNAGSAQGYGGALQSYLQSQNLGNANAQQTQNLQYGAWNTLQGQQEQNQLANLNATMQGNEFNANLAYQYAGLDQNAINQFQLAQMGYGNQQYANLLQQLGGYGGQGISGSQGILGQGFSASVGGNINPNNMISSYAGMGAGGAGYPQLPGNPYSYTNPNPYEVPYTPQMTPPSDIPITGVPGQSIGPTDLGGIGINGPNG